MKKYILLHYSEVGLKGANKGYFEEKLVKFLKRKLQAKFKKTLRIRVFLGRVIIDLPEKSKKELLKYLLLVPGIRNLQVVFEGSLDLNKVAQEIWDNLPEDFSKHKTFRITVKRSQEYPMTSMEAEKELGAELLRYGINMKGKMVDPDLNINVEIFAKHCYFSYEKIKGAGGLPPNTGGKMVALISKGIDSPVSAYRMIRRGARIIFLHFHAYPYTEKQDIENVKELIKILSEYQLDTKVYLVAFGDIQKKIATDQNIPAKLRVIFYRKLMFRIAEIIAHKEDAKGIVTGESFAQVASQTANNICAIQDGINLPVYQPLIACDKEDIVKMARELGTLTISELPCKDVCTMFTPDHPEIKAKIPEIREVEANVAMEDLVQEAFQNMKVEYFD